MSPVARLAARAIIAGVIAFTASAVSSMTGSDMTGNEWILAAMLGLGGAATAASLELGTPVNATVGINKGADGS